MPYRIADFWEYFQELITEHRGHSHRDPTGWSPESDTLLVLRAVHHTNRRIADMAKEFDDLKAAVQANTDVAAAAVASIAQKQETIDTQKARIADLEAQLAAAQSGGGGGGGGGSTEGMVPAADLVPLTEQLQKDDDALMQAMTPTPKP